MKTSNMILAGVLAAILILGIIPIFLAKSGINFSQKEKVEGNGNWETKSFDVSEFNDLDIQDHFDVYLKQGDFSVEIKAESNVMEKLKVSASNGSLVLKVEKGFRIKSKSTPQVFVSMPELKTINIAGAGKFETEGTFKAEDLKVLVSGATDMELELDCVTLKTQINGAGNIELSGKAEYFSSSNSGAGNIDAYDFVTTSTKITINGAGNANIHATERIDATINGAGSVSYAGNPEEVNKQINGFGSIDKRD